MKKGDTLIEVMLAIGIFSMVAVAVVAVMSNGTAGAQTALETTLAREEIDAQAEALRFIQSAYISDRNDDGKYATLWRRIIQNANELPSDESESSAAARESLVTYAPSSCPDVYTHLGEQKAFIINTRYLGEYSNLSDTDFNNNKNAVVKIAVPIFAESQGEFKEATTYPHLLYGTSDNDNDDKSSLISSSPFTNFLRAEGIYVIAVRDTGTDIVTGAIGEEGTTKIPAFYDFYIRTCWYGVGDNTPSTISTVIRLYDPDALGD